MARFAVFLAPLDKLLLLDAHLDETLLLVCPMVSRVVSIDGDMVWPELGFWCCYREDE
jgi:hypothetical protein